MNEVGSVEFGQVREDGDDREKRIQEKYEKIRSQGQAKIIYERVLIKNK